MATIGEVGIKLKVDTTEFKRRVRSAHKSLTRLEDRVDAIGERLCKLDDTGILRRVWEREKAAGAARCKEANRLAARGYDEHGMVIWEEMVDSQGKTVTRITYE